MAVIVAMTILLLSHLRLHSHYLSLPVAGSTIAVVVATMSTGVRLRTFQSGQDHDDDKMVHYIKLYKQPMQ